MFRYWTEKTDLGGGRPGRGQRGDGSLGKEPEGLYLGEGRVREERLKGESLERRTACQEA